MHKFWNFTEDDSGRTLRIEGQIADETWFGDEVTPQVFKNDLHAGNGDITLWINSPGGDVFAAAQIYNMLMDYKGDVHVVIDGLAASAASVIAMAGTTVSMSPVAMMMIHNHSTVAFGEKVDMQKAIAMLDEVKESIINAYETRSNCSRVQLAHMKDAETWMDAHKAVELGFADEIIGDVDPDIPVNNATYSEVAVTNNLMKKIAEKCKIEPKQPETKKNVTADSLMDWLNLMKNWRN